MQPRVQRPGMKLALDACAQAHGAGEPAVVHGERGLQIHLSHVTVSERGEFPAWKLDGNMTAGLEGFETSL